MKNIYSWTKYISERVFWQVISGRLCSDQDIVFIFVASQDQYVHIIGQKNSSTAD